jgi:N6-adenosine-specific RNA methylase IME4
MTTIPREDNLTPTEWAERLNEQWDRLAETTVEGFVRLGQDLRRCKDALKRRRGHGEWMIMVEHLKFHIRIAQKFMRIAEWVDRMRLIESHLPRLLPPDYNTINDLTRLTEPKFIELVRQGVVSPSLARNEVSKIVRIERVQADEARVINLRPVAGKFRTIILDPAWDYDWLSVAGRAKPGYAMQTLDDLHVLDVAAWADEEIGCHLYCWVTNNFMAQACKLVAHWGFQHRTLITWLKPPPFGLGSYFRNSTEHCIFATRGDTTTRPAAASIATHFEAERGEHSEKPEKFYEIVRAASYPPYGEANQREPRPDFVDLFEEQEEAAE